MMGYRKPAEDRADLLEAFARDGIDPEKYFMERLAELEGKPRPNPREVETLLLLRDSLLGKPKKTRKKALPKSAAGAKK